MGSSPLIWAPEHSVPLPAEALIGAKASGLAGIRAEASVPPFIVLTTEWARRGVGRGRTLRAAATDEEWQNLSASLEFIAEQSMHGIAIRPSIPFEPLGDRGSTSTAFCDSSVSAATATIEEILKAHRAVPSVAIVVQVRIAGQLGHLSNEFHLSRAPDQWHIECTRSVFEDDVASEVISISTASMQSSESTHTPDVLLDQLRSIARQRTSESNRWHFEWVFDGEVLWIVQADHEPPQPKAADPGAVWLNRHMVPLQPSRVFRRSTAADQSKYQKLRAQALFAMVGAPQTHLLLLDEPELIVELLAGRIPLIVREAMRTALAGGPVVVRTDVTIRGEGAVVKNLPRSDCLLSLMDFENFVRTCLCIEPRLKEGPECALIVHRFIAAGGCAIAYSRAESDTVQVDSMFGLPDGLSVYPHDSFTVAADGKLLPVVRYKPQFLDPTETGDWAPRRADPELAWRSSISATQAKEMASIARQVSAVEGVPLLVMFFTGGPPDLMPDGILPWIVDHEVPTSPPATNYAQTSRGLRGTPVVRTIGDFLSVGAHSRVIFRPPPSDVRDNAKFRAVAANAARHNIAIIWEGSVLAHGWYALTSGGATIIPLATESTASASDPVLAFNKLVRDGIPTKIDKGGERALVSSVSGPHLLRLLRQKLVEEAIEVFGAADRQELIEELADVLEVIDELLSRSSISHEDVEEVRAQKRASRGGFEQGIVLRRTFPRPSENGLPLADAGNAFIETSRLQDLTDTPPQITATDTIAISRIPSYRTLDISPRPLYLSLRGHDFEVTEDLKTVRIRYRGPRPQARPTDQLPLLD